MRFSSPKGTNPRNAPGLGSSCPRVKRSVSAICLTTRGILYLLGATLLGSSLGLLESTTTSCSILDSTGTSHIASYCLGLMLRDCPNKCGLLPSGGFMRRLKRFGAFLPPQMNMEPQNHHCRGSFLWATLLGFMYIGP